MRTWDGRLGCRSRGGERSYEYMCDFREGGMGGYLGGGFKECVGGGGRTEMAKCVNVAGRGQFREEEKVSLGGHEN